MPVHVVQTKIKSNVSYDELSYSLSLYKDVYGKRIYVLPDTGIKPLAADYRTQEHKTIDITEEQSTVYIMEVMLYRKTTTGDKSVLLRPATSIYSFGKFNGDNSSRENVCYYETLKSTKEQREGDGNIAHHLITRKKDSVFESPQHPKTDEVNNPFKKSDIEAALNQRKYGSSNRAIGNFYPNQKRTMLCGPAAFTYCLMMDRFDLYQQAIWDLWETGKTRIGSLVITASDEVKKPVDLFGLDDNGIEEIKIPAIDWIFMASLRDSSNNIMNYNKVSDAASAITMWGVMREWFSAVGAKNTFSNISLSHSNLTDISALNDFVDTVNYSTHIVALVSAKMMRGADTSFKDHWVVWESGLETTKITQTDAAKLPSTIVSKKTSVNENVMLKLFTWGEVRTNRLNKDLTLDDFLNCSFGGLVFTKIP